MATLVFVLLLALMCLTPVLAKPMTLLGKKIAKEAKPHQFPWMVRLDRRNSGRFCGGFLLRSPGNDNQSDLVMTAAHCIVKTYGGRPTQNYENKSQISLALGAHARTDAIEKSQGFAKSETRGIKDMLYHPKWMEPFHAHDIALIQLDKPVTFSDIINPIDLPKSGDGLDAGNNCTIAGWGVLFVSPNEVPEVLMYANVTICSWDKYRSAWGQNDAKYNFIYDSTYCVSPADVQAPAATCGGDSGGPLFRETNNRFVAHGVVSQANGVNCMEGRTEPQSVPDRVTKIESHLDWIEKTIREWSEQKSGDISVDSF